MYNVIGAGSTGLWLAKALGKDATVYEEHKTIGRPEHCTGLVSTRIDSLLKIPQELQLNRIKGARFFSANRTLELTRGRIEATVIDRAGFDAYLGELAESAGAKIMMGKAADPFSFPKDKAVFVAEGVSSRTLPLLGAKLKTLPSVQYVVRTTESLDMDFVELHFLRPDFFAWVVPEAEHIAKVGLATEKAPKELLESFLKKRLKSFIITEKQGSHIVTGGPLRRTVYGNLVLVGDTAGQVKATTGGGIITGMICAGIAAKYAGKPARYEREWRKKLGLQLEAARLIRKTLSKLSEGEYDSLLGFAERNSREILRKGDMDFHIGTLAEVFSRPKNIPMLAKYLMKAVF